MSIFEMILEWALIDSPRREEVESLSIEEVVSKVAHVNISISTVEHSFPFFYKCLRSIFADVFAGVFVLLFEDSIEITSCWVFNVFPHEFLHQLFLALQ